MEAQLVVEVQTNVAEETLDQSSDAVSSIRELAALELALVGGGSVTALFQ